MKRQNLAKSSKNQLSLIPEPSQQSLDGDWDFTSEDTQYLTHGLHPYLASMIPQIPRKLVHLYTRPGMRILDPFVGGGAVLVEAYLANLESTGIDVNPLATIVSKAKSTPIPSSVLIKVLELFDKIYDCTKADVPDFPKHARIDYWFKPYTYEPLARIRATIDELTSCIEKGYHDSLWNLLACIYSDTVRNMSLTYRGEVRLRRLQDEDLEKFNPNVVLEFKKAMNKGFARVSSLPFYKNIPEVHIGDSREISIENGYFDLVITSPPYGDIKNTIPYHQFSKNMLYWLGLGDKALQHIQKKSLGAKQGLKFAPRSATLLEAISRMSKKVLIHEATCFYHDYLCALQEITRVTSGRVIIVIGHRILDGTKIDNPQITTELMEQIGWRLEVRYDRTIRKKRLNKKMGFGNNAQGATIDSEAILVYMPSC
jgi:site-specific DNA-methyltransferase (cytosine-N4-specific)